MTSGRVPTLEGLMHTAWQMHEDLVDGVRLKSKTVVPPNEISCSDC